MGECDDPVNTRAPGYTHPLSISCGQRLVLVEQGWELMPVALPCFYLTGLRCFCSETMQLHDVSDERGCALLCHRCSYTGDGGAISSLLCWPLAARGLMLPASPPDVPAALLTSRRRLHKAPRRAGSTAELRQETLLAPKVACQKTPSQRTSLRNNTTLDVTVVLL